jgi:hypothetical protein
VLDGPKCSPGRQRSRWRVGVEPYANDLDAALLLARQRARGPRRAAPSSVGAGEAAEILDAVAPHTSIRPASLVLAGPRPDDDAVAALRAGGLRWGLWKPYDTAELRFVATLAVWEGSDSDLRIEPRVPTTLRASVTTGGRTRPVRVLDLTTTGAFLELEGRRRRAATSDSRSRCRAGRSRSSPTCAGCARRRSPVRSSDRSAAASSSRRRSPQKPRRYARRCSRAWRGSSFADLRAREG